MATIINRKAKGTITYLIKVYLGADENGKQIYSSATWKNTKNYSPEEAEFQVKKYAKEFEEKAKAEWEENQKRIKEEVKGAISFTDFVNKYWIPLYVENGEHKATTAEGYKNHIKCALSFFGNKKIRNITVLDTEKFMKWLRTEYTTQYGKPVSEKTAKHYFLSTRLVFEYAVKLGFIDVSPMALTKAPKVHRKKVDSLTKEETQRFLKALNSADLEFKTQMYLLLTSGLRRGELLGLQWNDINFMAGTADINRNIVRTTGNTEIIDTPKTDDSIRTVPLSSYTLALLAHLRSSSKSEWVFSLRKPDSLTTKLKRFMASNELPDCSPHKLRHTCATLLSQNGVDVKTIQEILGHADASTTLNYYIATDINQMKKAVSILDSALA